MTWVGFKIFMALMGKRLLAGLAWIWRALAIQVTLPIGGWLVVLIISCTISTTLTNNRGAKRLAALQATIDAPITGWAARLKDCHANVQTLINGQAQQNAAMTKRSAEATVTLKANAKAQDAIKPQVAARQAEAARILKPLVGADVCERMFEVDRRFVETLR